MTTKPDYFTHETAVIDQGCSLALERRFGILVILCLLLFLVNAVI